MYEAFYQLNGRPFVATALAAHYFRTASSESARETALRCVRRSEGAVLVVGGAGIGKSIFCSVIAQHLRPTHQVVTLAGGECVSRRTLLQTILHRLGRPFRMEEGELRLALVDYIGGYSLPATGLVLVIDEAQLLDVPLLEELRLLTNLVRYDQPCVHLVLAGNHVVEERLAGPRLESFNQRLAARCYLAPFSQAETRAFLAARLTACDGRIERLLTDDAVTRIHQATDGVPRLVNQLCDHALVLGAAAGRLRLDAAAIAEAWADLQQFPTPHTLRGETLSAFDTASSSGGQWANGTASSAGGTSSASAATIEFGTLEDEDEPAIQTPSAARQPASAAPSSGVKSSGEVSGWRLESVTTTAWPSPGAIDPKSDTRSAPSRAPQPLVLDDPVHARHHQFDDEEIVIDRYAQLESVGLGRRPKVASIEGRILGDLLQPFVQPPSHEHMRVVSPPTSEAESVADELETSDEHDHLHEHHGGCKSQVVTLGGKRTGGCSGTCGAVTANAWTDVIDGDAHNERAADDSDLIVIDDSVDDGSGRGIVRGAARRMEYDKLFDKLRRGTR
jgi:type II secretory pathway predicted ATPase ExeA